MLAPSIKHKLDSHLKLSDKVKGILPISATIVEVAAFDIQKILTSSPPPRAGIPKTKSL